MELEDSMLNAFSFPFIFPTLILMENQIWFRGRLKYNDNEGQTSFILTRESSTQT